METITVEQKKAALATIAAVADTIRECGEAPAGVLYAALVGRVSLAGFEKIIAMLKRAELVSESHGHMLTWTGPKGIV